jgi:hypothetical protein
MVRTCFYMEGHRRTRRRNRRTVRWNVGVSRFRLHQGDPVGETHAGAVGHLTGYARLELGAFRCVVAVPRPRSRMFVTTDGHCIVDG